MNKKRWLLATAILVSVIGSVVLVLALLPPRPGVTKANFDRIESGMAKADVLEILGEPSNAPFAQFPGTLKAGHTRVLWEADEFVGAFIVFDEHDLVFNKDWIDHTFFGRLRHKFPWLPF